MKNRDLYQRDPQENRLLNDGVVSVGDAVTEQEWRTLKFELEHFVCEGQYHGGLKRILEAYLQNLTGASQQAAWVSGFFGSGKSHTLKMLRHLWMDTAFPDGSTARGLVPHLPTDIKDLLKELSTLSKRYGGLHAASGTLSSGSGDKVRMAVLGIVLKSKGLPGELAFAKFFLWLKREGLYEKVAASISGQGKTLTDELHHLYVSPVIAQALIDADPGFAADIRGAREALRKQFPPVEDVTLEEFLRLIREILADPGTKGSLPCTLIVLDEIQLYIGDNATRSYDVQLMAEALCKQLDSRVMLIGAGQTALVSGVALLQRLKDRFTIPVELSDSDVENVTRKVVLAKKTAARAPIEKIIAEHQGEISRQLNSAKIGTRNEDRQYYVDDYPLLPVRRRFWEKALRAVDNKGFNNQLRTHLRIVYDAVQRNADLELGHVVPADFLYESLETELRRANILYPEMYELISKLDDGSEDGKLRRRLCGLIFLIRQLPRDVTSDIGVRATPEMLADLLVSDLEKDGVQLRQRIPAILAKLVEESKLMQVGEEYSLQTRESAEWEKEFRARQQGMLNDPHKVQSRINQRIATACKGELDALKPVQGNSRIRRDILQHMGQNFPQTHNGEIPIWVRDGWNVSEATVLEDARKAGTTSPVLFVFVPKSKQGDLQRLLVEVESTQATLDFKGVPASEAGREAQTAMITRRSNAEAKIGDLLKDLLSSAKVFKGGGSECLGMFLKEKALDGVDSSMLRLFPQFREADDPRWERVITQARGGAENALEILGFKDAAEKHPVCAETLRQVGSGQTGKAIREALEGSPFGWPRDAVDGALMVLHLTGHLRATYKGESLRSKELDQSKVSATEFRTEKVQLDTKAKLQLRKLYQNASVACQPGQEIDRAQAYVEELERLWKSAGGEPPLPAHPARAQLDALRGQAGQELAQSLLQQAAHLETLREEWKKLGDRAAERAESWRHLERLRAKAAGLAEAQELDKQAQVLRTERRLLDATDPVLPLRVQAVTLLRGKIHEVVTHCVSVHREEAKKLAGESAWKNLTPAMQTDLMREERIQEPEIPALGTEEDVLHALDRYSLSHWQAMTDALPMQFGKALARAMKYLEPKSQSVRLPRETLRNPEEVTAYLRRVEDLLRGKVGQGPVVVE
ncbi:MAG: BREX system P-loop protein BrxC [Fibrobacterota bacterium]|nr:BREX system P-loop protein BrxC [Fibrobacterota bacterium]